MARSSLSTWPPEPPGLAITFTFDTTAIAITPSASTAYATGNGTVTAINLLTGRPGNSVNIRDNVSQAIAITPDGRTAYVTRSDGAVTPVDLATGQPGRSISAGGAGNVIAITPDGKTACVLNGNTMVPIDLATQTLSTPITVAKNKGLVAITIVP